MALVDDHVLVRAGLAAWLAAHTDAVEVVASAATVAQLLDGPGRGAGVVLLDLNLGGASPRTSARWSPPGPGSWW